MLDLTPVFSTFPVLETERCILRALAPADAGDLLPMWSDPRVTRYVGRQPMASLEQAARRVDMLLTAYDDEDGIPWAIVRRADDRVLGTVVFWKMSRLDFRAEIGYELAPEAWGQGFMTEAARAVLAYGFTAMSLNRVDAETDPANTTSRRVLERLGFNQEGHLREYYYDLIEGRFTDKLVFSLLKAAWTKRADS